VSVLDEAHAKIVEIWPLLARDGGKGLILRDDVLSSSVRVSGDSGLLTGKTKFFVAPKIDPNATAAKTQGDAAAVKFSGADRWMICEVAYIKAMCAYLLPVLSDPQVQRAVMDTENAKRTSDAVGVIGAAASAGAGLGSVIPGIGTAIGTAVGAAAGAVYAAVQEIVGAKGLSEKREALARYLSGFLLNNPPPTTIALMASKARQAGSPPDVMLQMQGVLVRKQTLEQLYPQMWASVPAFPWKMEDGRKAGMNEVASALWTIKERGVGIWPTVEAPLLTFVGQSIGDTPECANNDARRINSLGRAWYSLDLGGLWPDLIPYITPSGKIASTALANMQPTLIWQNQYSGRASGSQAGVILQNLPCTSFIRLDLKALSQWGKAL
jgi:hypothetical protein